MKRRIFMKNKTVKKTLLSITMMLILSGCLHLRNSKVEIYPDDLASYLATLPENTSSSPHYITIMISSNEEFDTIKKALIGAPDKYVYLDLSGSTIETIPDNAFGNIIPWTRNSTLTGIIIPDSVTSIGWGAFANCTNMTSITIPDSVTIIGRGAFDGCTSLVTINVGSGNNVYTSENNILYNINKTFLHKYPAGKMETSFTIPDNVTSIGDNAFENCRNLTGITIPDSVTSIGRGAFSNCTSFASVTIPDSVTSIGDMAFDRCTNLVTINVGSVNNEYTSEKNVLYNKSITLLHTYPAGKMESSFTIPISVTNIGSSAFSYCTSLVSVTIPDSVTSIGGWAFYGCTSLVNVTIPTKVTSIEWYTFTGCTSLSSVTIPDSVTSIGSSAFSGCTSLASVTIPNGVTSIENSAFNGCISLISVTIPDSVTSIGTWAFNDCTNIASVTIGSSVTNIGWSAFSGCTRLVTINVNSSNNTYTSENNVLYNKNKTFLHTYPAGKMETSFIIPDNVTNIGDTAFSDCTSLASVTIPDSVTSIGMWAFDGCTSLASVTFQGTILPDDFNTNVNTFPGDLRDKFYALDQTKGTHGTYTRASGSETWTRQ
jgi:hypothetical protein